MPPNADSGGYTADQLEAGIGNALSARDMVAVVDILAALAAIDLDRAARVYKTLQVALDLADLLGVSPIGSSGMAE